MVAIAIEIMVVWEEEVVVVAAFMAAVKAVEMSPIGEGTSIDTRGRRNSNSSKEQEEGVEMQVRGMEEEEQLSIIDRHIVEDTRMFR